MRLQEPPAAAVAPDGWK
jgi:hypothetical protein